MPDPERDETFSSETTDDCNDDARTRQNRAGPAQTENTPVENVDQRSNAQQQDQPPRRDSES
jgi:hypothetical protein